MLVVDEIRFAVCTAVVADKVYGIAFPYKHDIPFIIAYVAHDYLAVAGHIARCVLGYGSSIGHRRVSVGTTVREADGSCIVADTDDCTFLGMLFIAPDHMCVQALSRVLKGFGTWSRKKSLDAANLLAVVTATNSQACQRCQGGNFNEKYSFCWILGVYFRRVHALPYTPLSHQKGKGTTKKWIFREKGSERGRRWRYSAWSSRMSASGLGAWPVKTWKSSSAGRESPLERMASR